MWNAISPGFELVSPCPIPATITITPRALYRSDSTPSHHNLQGQDQCLRHLKEKQDSWFLSLPPWKEASHHNQPYWEIYLPKTKFSFKSMSGLRGHYCRLHLSIAIEWVGQGHSLMPVACQKASSKRTRQFVLKCTYRRPYTLIGLVSNLLSREWLINIPLGNTWIQFSLGCPIAGYVFVQPLLHQSSKWKEPSAI